jgi:hypothetical protein
MLYGFFWVKTYLKFSWIYNNFKYSHILGISTEGGYRMYGRQGVQMGPQQVPAMGEGTWYVSDMGQTYGPMSWYDVKKMGDSARVTPYAFVKEENWTQWAPITYYFRVRSRTDLEADGLMPSRYDALFWLGVFAFLVGIFVMFASLPLGILIIILSPIIEFYALYLESVHKEKALTRSIGNAMAIIWIVVQLLVSFFMISALV